ncbi:bifunctional 2-polyprenyl-6-hydroxyphenol methylase/3-demethylubiquinol 3-O-methyltransferase UbiG [Geminocystis sp. NIES-3709]|uniref:class I SAM-dependent methyltransferase n=1 Tax=Geminocystis sp. NIES-3709 TaxID=1617448 RepID=UPI0005FCA906|nr:class I SAM-dependent methyltransferase [Geminocystis sp. NIES-3709]BAQ63740.1 hypothetical protein GM3709_505 [Geminocystis sp. NIES-3709]
MLEINVPNINTKKIKEKIISEIESIQTQEKLYSEEHPLWITIQEQIKYFQGFIETAKSRAEIRNSWPNSLNKFPFTLLQPLAIIFFKILKLLFKDQREVNYNILKALEESVKLNQMFLEQIKAINLNSQEELNTVKFINLDLKNKINTLDNKYIDRINYLTQKQEDLFYKSIYFQGDLTQQKLLINLFLNQLLDSQNTEILNKPIKEFIERKNNYLDSFYLALENKFRGKREAIKEQQKKDYLSLLQGLNIDSVESQILDIGCGRGEWLEVLKELGYNAKGIDLNEVMVNECCGRNLDVINQDCLDYLKSLSVESLSLITGFHLIEHLPFNILWELLAQSLRVLKSGGLVIFETPNPDNVLVGSRNFYIDPTHRNPLPSAMVKFLVESIGFINVEIINLHPISDQKIEGGELADRFNEYFYCSQDYAVIGYKP